MGNSSYTNYVYAVKHKDDGQDCSPIFRNPKSPGKLIDSPY